MPSAEFNQVGGIDLSALDAGFANSPLGQTIGNVKAASPFDISSLIHSFSSSPDTLMQQTQGQQPQQQPQTPMVPGGTGGGAGGLQMSGANLITDLLNATGGSVKKNDLASGDDLSKNSKIEGDQQKLSQGEVPDKKDKGNDKADKFMKIIDAGMKIWSFLSKMG